MHNLAFLLKFISHGVYVIGVGNTEQQNAFTAAWVMQASFNPPLLALSINPKHYSYSILQSSGICSINILAQEQLTIAEHFGRSGLHDKMASYQWIQAKTGAPILVEAIAYFDCKVSGYCSAGDHQLVLCEIVDAGLLQAGTPLLYVTTGDMDDSSNLYKQSGY